MGSRRRIGRYELLDCIARGGMGSVHLGRAAGDAGFERIVAIKRHHPQFAKDPAFVDMLLDEARLAARIHHPNVVSVLDVVADAGELLIVMEWVPGLSFATLGGAWNGSGTPVPASICAAVALGILDGLHAAHEAKSASGEPLHIVHRDVSPQNLIVGRDGLVRLVDFGVALAAERVQVTRTDEIKGKLAYMAPEQLRRGTVDRRADLFGLSVVLWEALTGRRMHDGIAPTEILVRIVGGEIERPSAYADVPPALEQLVMRGLSASAEERPNTALDMARELERTTAAASTRELAAWMQEVGADRLPLLDAAFEKASRARPIEPAARPSAPPPSVTDATETRHGPGGRAAPSVPPPSAAPTHAKVDAASPPTQRTSPWPAVIGAASVIALVALVVLAVLALRREPASVEPSTATSTSTGTSPGTATATVTATATATAMVTATATPTATVAETETETATGTATGTGTGTATATGTGTATATGTGTGTATATATATGTATGTGTSTSASTKTGKVGGTKKPAKPGCDPPYTIDAEGVRVPKRECYR